MIVAPKLAEDISSLPSKRQTNSVVLFYGYTNITYRFFEPTKSHMRFRVFWTKDTTGALKAYQGTHILPGKIFIILISVNYIAILQIYCR